MTITAAEIEAAKARVPHAFRAPSQVILRRRIVYGGLIALFLWCVFDFEFIRVVLFDYDRRTDTWSFEPWQTFYEYNRRTKEWTYNPWLPIERLYEGLDKARNFFEWPRINYTAQEWRDIGIGLGETLSMAFLGTVLGAAIAFPLGWLGAKNILPLGWIRVPMRRGFDFIRAFETLILAMIFIRAFGLGPLAGILAITISEIGSFSKLFAEAIENTSKKPVEGVMASGGSALQRIRFGINPQVAPVIMSIILYNFESNTRSGTILGIVGAGGIGFILSDRIRAYRWDEVWTIIILIIIMVYIIDWISGKLRERLIGKWEPPT
ncbi:MAG: phosphonate ABC transporter, permease protein PhnE [Pseudomonadota bacterium]